MAFKLMNFIDTKDMSEEDVKKWEGIDEAFSKAMDDYLKDKIDLKSIGEKIIEQIKSLDEFKKEDLSKYVDSKSFKDAMDDVKETLLVLKAATEKGNNGEVKVKSWEDQLAEQLKDYIVDDKGKKTVDLRSACTASPGNKKTINLVLDTKAVSTVTSGTVAPHFGLQVDPVLSVNPRALTVLRSVANVASTNSRALVYAEYESGEGDAKWVAEGALKPNMDGTLTEKTVKAGKVAITAKFTEETLMDLPQLVAEVRAEMINKLGITEEKGILNGTGANGEIVGVASDMPGFSLTLANKIQKANYFDAIVACYTQIVSVSNMAYVPNAILINPIDYMRMQLEKDTNGQYLRPFRIGDELIKGLQVVQTTAVPVGELWIGDWNYLNIRDLQVLTITMGWENDDFTKNLVTIIAEKRLMAYIKSQYKTAFVKDKFATVVEAINATDDTGSTAGE